MGVMVPESQESKHLFKCFAAQSLGVSWASCVSLGPAGRGPGALGDGQSGALLLLSPLSPHECPPCTSPGRVLGLTIDPTQAWPPGSFQSAEKPVC